jgi:hypothetical protein
MPGFDGTGPLGQGPMTGRGMGFCVLRESKDRFGQAEGLVGIQGTPIGSMNNNLIEEKEVIDMPFGDGTGPAGLGPMTGRAAGFCAGYPVPGFMNPVGGRGYWGWGRGRGGGRGRGFGRGFGWARAGYGWPAWGGAVNPYVYGGAPFAPTMTSEQDLEGLKQQAEYFQDALDEIKERMKELESQAAKTKK